VYQGIKIREEEFKDSNLAICFLTINQPNSPMYI
jgi:hypothetical protein